MLQKSYHEVENVLIGLADKSRGSALCCKKKSNLLLGVSNASCNTHPVQFYLNANILTLV